MNVKDSNSEYGLIIRSDVILYQISPKAHGLIYYCTLENSKDC